MSGRFHKFAPILWIAAAVVLLMGLLAYFTYANYRRQQDVMGDFLTREGLSLIRAMEAGVRIGMLDSTWSIDQLQRTLTEVVKDRDVLAVAVHNQAGAVSLRAGQTVDLSDQSLLALLGDGKRRGRVIGEEVAFVVVDRFQPFEHDGPEGRAWRAWRDAETFEAQYGIVSVSLSMRHFQAARREDTRRAIGTAVVILLIGGAGFYFLGVLQRSQAMQEALSETRSYAKHVVDSISNGVFSVDRDGWVVSMNRAAGEILGIAPNEAVGRFYRELIAEGPCRLEPVIQQGERFLEKEMACRSIQGQALEVVVSASQLRNDEGVVLGAVVVIRDLREIRRLQEQLRRSERLASVGQMVAGVAHEFRNPLSTIKGFARYFQKKYKDAPEDGEYADLMIQEVDRLNRVITDMLGFAQPLRPQIQVVDFHTVLDRALTLCNGAISEKHIQLHTQIKENGTPTADVDLMIQVMVNLIQNAVQAVGEAGHIDIEVERQGQETVIAISDDGSGITAEDRERLFDPFFTTKSDGTGLGLSIVHSIVERHGGRIEVDSEPGQGTRFRVIIPQVEV